MLLLIAQNNIDIAAQQDLISPVRTVGRLVELGANAVLIVGGLAVLMYLLMGALNWLTAGGDKSKVETAKSMITQAIIGLAILSVSFAAYRLMLRFFGIEDRIVIGGGSGTSGGSGGSTGAICQIGQTASDGGAGGYCTNGGAAQVKCMTTPNITYAHWEPCSCMGGSSPSWNWKNCNAW